MASPPNATITAPTSNVTILAGQSVTFEGSCTHADGSTVTHQWTFGGGAPDAQVESPGAVTFATAGTFVATYQCTDDSGASDPTPDTRTITVQTAGAQRQLSGVVTFDKVPSTDQGLNFAGTVQTPVQGAELKVVDAATHQTVVASTLTGSDGSYSVSWSQDVGQVQVIVYATSDQPKIVVKDNTNAGTPWAMVSSAIDPAATTTLNLNAGSGWTGSAYTKPRSAAPFAVLDAAYRAAHAFLAVRPDAPFPPLDVNWSPNNAPVGPQGSETQEQAYAAGHIETSHWNGTALYILGEADVDTDEFDDHVIVHEWGHYFESKLGRSDSPGGSHSAGEIKDPRLAFGEGWGNALSAMVWAPRSEYTDTSGTGEASGFGFDMEDNLTSDPNPGWFSEASVQSVLYDLFDDSGTTEAYDSVALGFGPIYDVMTGAQKSTPALTTLFSFIAALKAANPDQAAAIDTLTQYHGVTGVPVADAYGTGETNAGGSADNLPVYHALTAGGGTVSVVFHPGAANDLAENRYLTFTGDGASHDLTFSTAADIDIAVYSQGALVQSQSVAASSTGSLTVQTSAGTDYVVTLTSSATSTAQTDVTLQ